MIVLQNLASFYRDLLIAKTAPTRNDLAAITPPTWAQMTTFANGAEIGWILQGQQHLRSAEVQIKHTTQPRLWLEITLMGLLPSALGSVVTPPTSIARMPTVARSQAAPTTAPPQTQHQIQPQTPTAQSQTQSELAPKLVPIATRSETTPDSLRDLVALWQEILSNIEEPSTRAVLSTNCYIIELTTNEIKIGILQKTSSKIVTERRSQLGKACAETLKRSIKLEFVVAVKKNTEGKNPEIQPPKVQPLPIDPTLPTPPTQHQNVVPITHQAPPKPVAAPIINHRPKPVEVGEVPSWEVDELTQATKNLAMAFDGKIVTLNDEIDAIEEPDASLPTIAQIMGTEALEELEDGQDEDDVDF